MKNNKLCIIQFYALQNLTANSEIVIGTIPEGYRPVSSVQIRGISNDNLHTGITIYTDGSIGVYGYNTTGANIRISAAYFTP